jgi:hypothetical protein
VFKVKFFFINFVLEGGLVPACKEKRFIVEDAPLFRFYDNPWMRGSLIPKER